MKTRLSKVLNFLAFNVLFFALYLNFIHKGSDVDPVMQPIQTNARTQSTVLIERQDHYLEKASSKHVSTGQSIEQKDNPGALKLYFN